MSARVAAAEANLRVAKAEYDRYQALLGRQLVSQSQFDNADNAYRAAAARLQQARAEFDAAAPCRLRGAACHPRWADRPASHRSRAGGGGRAGRPSCWRPMVSAKSPPICRNSRWSATGSARKWRSSLVAAGPAIPRPDSRVRRRPTRSHGPIRARRLHRAGDVPAELGQSALVSIRRDDDVALAVPLSALSAEQGRRTSGD